METESLPWRGPGPGRPNLPLPPDRMPLRASGQLRKRWRYVGVFDDRLMLCAASASVGPFRQSFWVLWDRTARRCLSSTRMRPGSREVMLSGAELLIGSPGVRARLRLGEAPPVEAICPSGSGWGWTRKRAGVPVEGVVEADGRRWEIRGRGVDDESAGYHRRRTSWHWSAGVGTDSAGRPVAWNLVEGINDPAQGSERGIWVENRVLEPPPVSFDGLSAVEFGPGRLLEFESECERARDDNFLIVRSRYRHRFGSYVGKLGELTLAEGLGVMERHDALW